MTTLTLINTGTQANDKTGDPVRTAFTKVNQNFAAVDAGKLEVSAVGQPGGAASLDGSGVVPLAQIPGSVGTKAAEAAASAVQAGASATAAASSRAQASAAADRAEAQALSTITIPSQSLISQTGSNLPRPLADILTASGTIIHSRDIKEIDHSGATNSMNGLFKMMLQANALRHTTFIIDAEDVGAPGIKLGNDAASFGTVVGSMNCVGITYQSTNLVRYSFSGGQWVAGATYPAKAVVSNGGRVYRSTAGGVAGSTAPVHTSGAASDDAVLWEQVGLEPGLSAFTTAVLAANRAFLTVRNASLDANRGIFQISAVNDTAGIKTIDVITPRTNASQDETGTVISACKAAGQEPWYYPDNCTIIIRARLVNYVNSGINFCICSVNPSDDAGVWTTNVHFDWQGGRIVFPTRTTSQSRKGLGITFTDVWSVKSYRTEGNDANSFSGQCRSATRGYLMGGGLLSGDSVGEDGWHFIRSCKNISVSGLIIESGDDAISFTQENGGIQYAMEDITVTGCSLRSKGYSAVKVLVDASSAALGSTIKRLNIIGNNLSLHDAVATGNLVRVISLPGYEDRVSAIKIKHNTGDSTSGTLASPSMQVDYATGVDISGNDIKGILRNGILFNGGFRHRFEDNDIGMPASQLSVTDIIGLSVASITYVNTTTFRVAFNNSPDLSSATTSFTTITLKDTAGFNRTYLLSAVDNTNKAVNITVGPKTGASGAALNETPSAATAYIRKQAGEVVKVQGGDGHKIQNNRIFGSYNDANGRVICSKDSIYVSPDTNGANVLNPTPKNMEIGFNTIHDQLIECGINLRGCQDSSIIFNKGINCSGRLFISEGTDTENGNNEFLENREKGSPMSDLSYQFAKASSRSKGNIGSNGDRIQGSITIPAGSTTATIVIPNNLTTPTGTNITGVSGPWTRGYVATFPQPRHLKITPTSSFGAASNFRVGYASGSKTYTVTLNVDPGAAFTADWELNTAHEFA